VDVVVVGVTHVGLVVLAVHVLDDVRSHEAERLMRDFLVDRFQATALNASACWPASPHASTVSRRQLL
jgi:hypothetical protein